jgi:hypothetical protein
MIGALRDWAIAGMTIGDWDWRLGLMIGLTIGIGDWNHQ